MALTVSNLKHESAGSEHKVIGSLAFDNSYVTGGETLQAAALSLSRFSRLKLQPEQGYEFEVSYGSIEPTSVVIKVFQGGTAAGTVGNTSAGTPAGTVAAPVFTGNALAAHGHNIQTTQDEVIAVTAGTGVSAALTNVPVGSVDNVYIVAGGVTGAAVIVPVGSVANSKEVSINYTTGVLQFLVADAVTSAKVTYASAAVSTTSGGTPSGTNSAPAFTGSALGTHTHTFTGSGAAGAEVANATDLSALSAVEFEAYGY